MKTPNKEDKNFRNNFVKYTGIFFQMLVVIGLFAFIGYKIDEHRNSRTPIYTEGLSLVGFIISIYQVVKQLNNKF